MPRWEHGSDERLRQAAMELFAEQGFDETSAVQIAARARVTTRTFFRYFPDKEEVLFADAETLERALTEALLATADVTDPLRAVLRTLSTFDWEQIGSRAAQHRRYTLITAHPQLLERELIKQHQLADALRDVLCRRGVDPDTAELAAYTGSQVFRTAYRQWLAATGDTDLTAATEAALARLATIVPATTRR